MANIYTWVISQLDCYPEHAGNVNVVFRIHYRFEASDNENNTVYMYGSQDIVLDNTAPFTPYNNLTQAQVETWLTSALGEAYIEDMKINLNAQIFNLINPTVVAPHIPWDI